MSGMRDRFKSHSILTYSNYKSRGRKEGNFLRLEFKHISIYVYLQTESSTKVQRNVTTFCIDLFILIYFLLLLGLNSCIFQLECVNFCLSKSTFIKCCQYIYLMSLPIVLLWYDSFNNYLITKPFTNQNKERHTTN